MSQCDPDFLLSEKDLEVLHDIRGFLSIPHVYQEYLASDYTPTIPWVLFSFLDMLELLKDARKCYPKIVHAIDASIQAAEQYMAYTQRTRMYALAMSMLIPLIVRYRLTICLSSF